MDNLQANQRVLLLAKNSDDLALYKPKLDEIKVTIECVNNYSDVDTSHKYDMIISTTTDETALISLYLKLNPKGALLLVNIPENDSSNIEFILKTNGYVNTNISNINGLKEIICNKPSYDIGSSAKITLKKPATVWKLDDDDEEETIDPDNLLDEDDLKRPTEASLKVCGTTGVRKACKDCTCGLAEELANEGEVVDTGKNPKSSCGNCYLGDAFRCAACPYLGMPAFKPGEKIQLAGNLLKDDL